MPPKSGFCGRRLGVGVGVERVAGELREVVDVLERHGARVRRRWCRRCAARRGSCGRGGPRPSVARGEPVVQRPVIAVVIAGEAWIAVRCMWWRTARTPPSSSPPPARPGPPCTSIGSGEPWPVDSAGVVAVEDQDPAVPRRQAEHHGAGDVGVVGDHGRHQAAAAAGRELDGLVEGVVGEHRADRPERLDVVRLDRAAVGAQQHGGEERATLGVAVEDVDVVGVAVDDLARGAQRLDGLAHLLALLERDQRAHAGVLVARVADRDLGQPVADRLDDRVRRRCRARSRGGWRCTSGRP